MPPEGSPHLNPNTPSADVPVTSDRTACDGLLCDGHVLVKSHVIGRLKGTSMAAIHIINFDGQETVVEIENGISLMEGAIKNGVAGIESDCGGECACGTCKILIGSAWIEKTGLASEDERDMLEFRGEAPEFARLACQVTVSQELDGLTIFTPKNQDGEPEFSVTETL
jgi:2Fe-2S ferredoxin